MGLIQYQGDIRTESLRLPGEMNVIKLVKRSAVCLTQTECYLVCGGKRSFPQVHCHDHHRGCGDCHQLAKTSKSRTFSDAFAAHSWQICSPNKQNRVNKQEEGLFLGGGINCPSPGEKNKKSQTLPRNPTEKRAHQKGIHKAHRRQSIPISLQIKDRAVTLRLTSCLLVFS